MLHHGKSGISSHGNRRGHDLIEVSLDGFDAPRQGIAAVRRKYQTNS